MKKKSLAPQRGFFPQPVYLIGTIKDDGTANFATITWITFCSADPPKIMFALRGRKLTRDLVEKRGMFSANLATADMARLVDYCGGASGYHHDKCFDTGAEWRKGAALDVPVLDASPWVYECRLDSVIPLNDSNIYTADVVGVQVCDAIGDTSYGRIDMASIDPLIYAPGQYYRLTPGIAPVGFSKASVTGNDRKP